LGADGEIDKSIRTVVRLRLESERQQIVFDRSAPLSEWEWGVARTQEEKAFVYLRGAVTFVPVRQGVTSYTPMGVGPDGGWGTYFSPRDAATYTLRFQALSPRAGNWPSSVRLIAKGRRMEMRPFAQRRTRSRQRCAVSGRLSWPQRARVGAARPPGCRRPTPPSPSEP
jgi:hypothetical protein